MSKITYKQLLISMIIVLFVILFQVKINFNSYSLKGRESKRKDLFHLRKLITKHKVSMLTKNFINKLRKNNTCRHPPDLNFLQASQQLNLYQKFLKMIQNEQGLVLGSFALIMWSFINIIQIIVMVFAFTIMITFAQTQNNPIFIQYRIASVILSLCDIVLNFTTQRFQNGKKLTNLREISEFYIKNGFIIDFTAIITTPIYLLVDFDVTIMLSIVSMISLSRLWNSLLKFQRFEYIFVKTSEQEQYYGLIKVFITNFVIGHFLSIMLNLMANINPQSNWYRVLNIEQQQWYYKYVWGYYWGTNIMLTVGFGDLHASTATEAVCLIFIQTFSCITLAYNISTVGSLMTRLKEKGQRKKKQLKTFHRMSQQNQIPPQLTTRVSNFIQQSFEIRETFEFQQQDKVIQSLPKGIQSQFRIESNKILFDNVGFMNNMSSKTLVNLAQNIERKISHPQEIINKIGSLSDFSIISSGSVGLCCKKRNSLLTGQVIQKITVDKGHKPKLLSLKFIKGQFYQYDVKSLGYSIIYILERKQFMNCLKDFQLDYQYFCTIKDKDQYLYGQNELYPCAICKTQFHNKFNCNRLHYLPIKQMVVNKYLIRKPKCSRFGYQRGRKINLMLKKPFMGLKVNKKQLKQFLNHQFGPIYIQKIEMMQFCFEKNIQFQAKQKQRTKMQTIPFRSLQNSSGMNLFEDVYNLATKEFSDQIIKNRKFHIDQQSKFQKIENILLRQKSQFCDFWDLETDQIHNFKYYFTSFNGENLQSQIKVSIDKLTQFI